MLLGNHTTRYALVRIATPASNMAGKHSGATKEINNFESWQTLQIIGL
jgi:hypothetical protein